MSISKALLAIVILTLSACSGTTPDHELAQSMISEARNASPSENISHKERVDRYIEENRCPPGQRGFFSGLDQPIECVPIEILNERNDAENLIQNLERLEENLIETAKRMNTTDGREDFQGLIRQHKSMSERLENEQLDVSSQKIDDDKLSDLLSEAEVLSGRIGATIAGYS